MALTTKHCARSRMALNRIKMKRLKCARLSARFPKIMTIIKIKVAIRKCAAVRKLFACDK